MQFFNTLLLGIYLPTKYYSHGRTMFEHKDDPEILLVVSRMWMVHGVWTVLTKGRCFLHSAAAGDMNPASERNNHCEKCGWVSGSEEMSSWAYFPDDMSCSDENRTSIQSDKIKVVCENGDESGAINKLHNLEESTNVVEISDLDEASGSVDQSRNSDESSGEWNSIS